MQITKEGKEPCIKPNIGDWDLEKLASLRNIRLDSTFNKYFTIVLMFSMMSWECDSGQNEIRKGGVTQ
jgi:hypothetical protein